MARKNSGMRGVGGAPPSRPTVGPLSGGTNVKGGQNPATTQIVTRPPPPAPINPLPNGGGKKA